VLRRLAAIYTLAIDWYEDLGRRAPVRFAGLTVALLFALTFSIFQPGFDTNDDAVMNMVVAGKGYGLFPDEHMVFSNVLLGLVLKSLYTTWPSIPWYGAYLVSVHFLAQTVMLFCIIRPGYTRLRLRLYLAYFAVAGLYVLNNLQFTSAAFLTGQSGVILLLWLMRRFDIDKISVRQFVPACALAFALLVFSSLVRREVFYPVVGLAIPTCGLMALFGRRPIAASICAAGILALAFAVAAGCWRYNQAYYDADAGWRNFYEYNKVRVKFNDEAWVRYSPEMAYLFREVGWSENDFEMLNSWFFDDENRYSLQALQHVLTQYSWRESRVSADMFASSIAAVFFDRESLALFLVLPILVFCMERRTVNFAVVGGMLAMAGALIAYLILFSKTPPSRVYVPTLAFPLAVAACLSHGSTYLPPERFRTWLRMVFSQPAGWRRALRFPLTKYVSVLVLLAMCTGVASGSYQQYRRSRERIKSSNQLYDLLSSIDASDDKLFICWAATFPYEALRPFDTLKSMEDLHLLVLGWPQKTPLHYRMKQRFGIRDLAEAIYRRNDLYLVAHPYYLGLYEQYIREHFGVELCYETRQYARLFSVTQASARPADPAHADDRHLASPRSPEKRMN
jgi:hypothetical protein